MEHKLPPLPFAKDALVPHLSKETFDYHYEKHHAAYVANLNKLIPGTEFQGMTLEEIVMASTGTIFNNAAQIWNHTFYWNSLSPAGGGEPGASLGKAITKNFGTFADFQEKFLSTALGTFGSGWVWLVKGNNGTLFIESTGNAATPFKEGRIPLITCDVWEHAYYIDYRNARGDYVKAFWKIANWKFAEANFSR
jgi:Fe-Mn family superoxide dismutase